MRSLLFAIFTALTAAQSCPPWNVTWSSNDGTDDQYSGQYESGSGLCVYRNVRYASPPTQERGLRFVAPDYPPKGPFPPPENNPSCVQMSKTPCVANLGHVGGSEECFGGVYGNQTEDCLFLDVWVPSKAFAEPLERLPVVVWYYGGAYVFGSKQQFNPSKVPFYSGEGFVNRAEELFDSGNGTSMIFVTGNYRLGAFGWLAGDSFRKSGGQTNAGLLDQRAMLKFVRDQIGGVKGDPDNVSVWGESAGASSIMHHLTMPENIATPLFNKAILQSPAYQWLWDQTGALNDTWLYFWRNVSQSSGPETPLCGPSQSPLDCLRFNENVTTSVLNHTNQMLFEEIACRGIMPVGPSVDGDIVPTLAPISFYQGKVADIQSIIVSHVDLEVPYSNNVSDFSFIPYGVRKYPNDGEVFDGFVQSVFPGPSGKEELYEPVWNAIEQAYPSPEYSDQIARAATVIAESSFLCNTRNVINTYVLNNKSVYAMDYAVLRSYAGIQINASTHGSDLLPAFHSSNGPNYTDLFHCILPNRTKFLAKEVAYEIVNKTAPGMQWFFDSHAIFGEPNHNRRCGVFYPCWYPATNDELCQFDESKGTCVGNLMKPHTALVLPVFSDNKGQDVLTSNATCKFWHDMAVLTMDLYNSGGSGEIGDEISIASDEHPAVEYVENDDVFLEL